MKILSYVTRSQNRLNLQNDGHFDWRVHWNFIFWRSQFENYVIYNKIFGIRNILYITKGIFCLIIFHDRHSTMSSTNFDFVLHGFKYSLEERTHSGGSEEGWVVHFYPRHMPDYNLCITQTIINNFWKAPKSKKKKTNTQRLYRRHEINKQHESIIPRCISPSDHSYHK